MHRSYRWTDFDRPAFYALALENDLEYHYLHARINSSDDQATSDINLVGF